LLILDGDDVLTVVSQEQGATGAIVEAFDPAVEVRSPGSSGVSDNQPRGLMFSRP
jgi:hypothetical protein